MALRQLKGDIAEFRKPFWIDGAFKFLQYHGHS